VFAPNSKYRAQVTPAKRGKCEKSHSPDKTDQTPAEKRASMTWAKRLKRVFDIDIETCSECGGDVRIIASIEDPALFRRYSLTWMATQLLQQQHSCRIAELRLQRACSTEKIDPNQIPDPLFLIW
jgi:hypothetical protein